MASSNGKVVFPRCQTLYFLFHLHLLFNRLVVFFLPFFLEAVSLLHTFLPFSLGHSQALVRSQIFLLFSEAHIFVQSSRFFSFMINKDSTGSRSHISIFRTSLHKALIVLVFFWRWAYLFNANV